jgi:hypothetical protein
MAKAAKKKTSKANPALKRRYGSIAEIKREFFPNAAAEEEANATAMDDPSAYEDLMAEFFGQQQHRLPA